MSKSNRFIDSFVKHTGNAQIRFLFFYGERGYYRWLDSIYSEPINSTGRIKMIEIRPEPKDIINQLMTNHDKRRC